MSAVTSRVTSRDRLSVPESLKQQLHEFRRRVWSTQMLSALAFALAGLLLAFLTVFLLDRWFDTPKPLRLGILLAMFAATLTIPWALYHWVWKHRKLDQLARLLRVRESSIGDQLLSVIELADSDYEQARSRTLCAAAFVQVAEAARSRDLTAAAPRSRAATWSTLVVGSLAVVLTLGSLAPEAVSNAWTRMTAPWSNTPRYTFTSIEELPAQMIVAHGESTPLAVHLRDGSRWQPAVATLELAGLPTLQSSKQTASSNATGSYQFEIPPQTEPATVRVRVGDFSQAIEIVPKMRPELVAASAAIKLPEYLQQPKTVQRDVRGGTLRVVNGSSARVEAVASRSLKEASINEQPVAVNEATFQSDEVAVVETPDSMQLTWRDQDGLAGREPFELTVQAVEDERPSIASQQLPRQAVLLDSEQLNFSALAADDFGVKRIGFSYRGLDDRMQAEPAKGEKLIAAGGPEQSSLQSPAVFSAKSLGIKPQPIEVRLWVEDYLPDRPRVYSPPHIFYVLSPEEHAIWITEQLSKWHRASLEVRDRELTLHETNKRLREMSPEELADEELRKQLQAQAGAEANNGRKLSGLSKLGENLLRQAARNPEIGVGHLDRWAEMLQVLNDISANRMPSVSDLLAKASTEAKPSSGKGQPKQTGPTVGQQRGKGGGSGKQPDKLVGPKQPKLPSITDSESALQPPDNKAGDEGAPKKKYNGSRFTLPNTTLAGPAKKGDKQPEQEAEEPADDESTMDKALFEQEELLAEFERIADEMNTILANLEGSTLVKRLKAASREQTQVAERVSSRIAALFGRPDVAGSEDKQLFKSLNDVEQKGSQKVSYIMDDMHSYFERRRMNQFKVVLDDMRQSDVLGALRQLGEELPKEQGMSLAQAEYWADTLDRWAEDLVNPACSGSCPGCKNSDALPPSVILEVLQILEGEVNLREATRVAQQAKAASTIEVHGQESTKLSATQSELGTRTDKVVTRIQELPEGDKRFGKEIALLSKVSQVMGEATGILRNKETGDPAIAAETEAIELLLQCKRINPKGGGGGGTSPGGGGGGTTQDSALALLGSGLNQNEKREQRDVSQATGETGRVLPEEFRAGLDQYFNLLESGN